MPDLKNSEEKKFGGKFIVNKSNFYNFVVNLEIINNIDYDVETFWTKEIYTPLMTTVEKNNRMVPCPFVKKVFNKSWRFLLDFLKKLCYNLFVKKERSLLSWLMRSVLQCL